MKIRLLFAILFCPLFVSAQAPSCSLVPKILEQASKLRGLAFSKSVPCEMHSKDEIKKFILDTIDTKLPPQKMKYEEQLYKAIGLIPEDFDYTKELVDFYVSQIGGYYDPSKKHYIMAAWMPEMLQAPVAAHELTHALQDQHFNLETFLDNDKYTSDELLARSALLEGDATAIMLDYARAQIGQGSIAADNDVTMAMMSNVLNVGLMSGGDRVPQAIKFLAIFPYTSGLRFAHEQLKKGGYKEIDKAFNNPPRSTTEILHPEKYGSFSANIPAANGAMPYKDTLGEFFISVLLGAKIDKAEATNAATGWLGDLAGIDQAGKVSWISEWESDKEAAEFKTAFQKLERGVVEQEGKRVIFRSKN